MAYKSCVVPKCISTTIKTPEKLFVSVPTNSIVRKKWLELANRDPNGIKSYTNVFMCEDHFNMENDIKNWMQYKMGFSKKLQLADGVLPSKFDCQQDHKRRVAKSCTSRIVFAKRKYINYFKTSQKEMDVIEENVSTMSVPEDLSEIEKMNLEYEMGKRKATYYHKKRNKQSKAAQLRFSKTKIPLIIAAREQTSHTLNEYVKDQSEYLLESSEIKIEEPDIKQEVQEDLLDIDPSLNTNVERMTFNSIDGECAVFNTASNETSSLNTEWNGDSPKSEFIRCESDYDGTIYLYSEALQEDPIDNNFKQINDVDIATENFNVSNEDGRTIGTASNGPSSQVRTCPRCKYVF